MAYDELANDKPYWNYEDIGIFFLALVLIGFVLRLLVGFHLFPRFELNNPSVSLQFLLIASLTLSLYLVLKLRHHRPVLHPLGWIWPCRVYLFGGLISGVCLASVVALYLRCCHRTTQQIGLMEVLVLGVSLGPVFEESFFRGCLMPLLTQTTGNVVAVILTAFLFALLHQPTDLAHWVSFTATGVAYGSIRVSSGSTMAAALMHATYNLALYLSASF